MLRNWSRPYCNRCRCCSTCFCFAPLPFSYLASSEYKSSAVLFDTGRFTASLFTIFRIRCDCPSDAMSYGSPFQNGSDSKACTLGSVSDDVHWTVIDDQIYAENSNGDLVPAYQCPDKATTECPTGLLCADAGNPYYGLMNFDNILWAWLSIFQIISMEGWTDVMYHYQDAISQSIWIYFLILIVVGSLFAVNLALAVLYMHFMNTDANQESQTDLDLALFDISSHVSQSIEVPITSRQRFSMICYKLQKSPIMENVTLFLIVLNVAVMAADRFGMPKWQEQMSEVINFIIAVYFLMEMMIKGVGLGWRQYIQDRSNLFDGAIAIAGAVELIIDLFGKAAGFGGSLYVLRIFRLLRVFKLSRSWKELNKIVMTVQGSISSMANLCLIFLIFIVVMALLGMQLFGYKLQFCDVPGARPICPPNRSCPPHPDCYLPCSAGEAHRWIFVFDSPYNQQAFCEVLDLDWPFWAQVGPVSIPRHHFDAFPWAFLTVFQILTGEDWNAVMYDLMRSTSNAASLYCIMIIIVGNYILLNLFLAILLDNFAGLSKEERSATNALQNQGTLEWTETETEKRGSTIQDIRNSYFVNKTTDPITEPTGNAVWLFSSSNGLRRIVHRIVSHKAFEIGVIGIVLCSSVCLALESADLDPHSKLRRVIDISDAIFVILFAIEAGMKILAWGFLFNGSESYLRDRWNLLDFAILLMGIVFQSGSKLGHFKWLRALRAFRCLKPLRLATRNKELKIVIQSLFQSVPPLMNVSLVCLLFYLTFAILGVTLLKVRIHFVEFFRVPRRLC